VRQSVQVSTVVSVSSIAVALAGVTLLMLLHPWRASLSGSSSSSSVVAAQAQQSIRGTLAAAGSPPIHIASCVGTGMVEMGKRVVYSCHWTFNSAASAAEYHGFTADGLAASRIRVDINGRPWVVTCFDVDSYGVGPSTMSC